MFGQEEIWLSITNQTENVLDFEINNMISNYTKPLGIRVKTYTNLCWIGDDNMNLFFQSIMTKKEQSVQMLVQGYENENELEIQVVTDIGSTLYHFFAGSRYKISLQSQLTPIGNWQCYFITFSNDLKLKLSNIQPKSTLNFKFIL
jgi:hypothetical protein